MSDADRALEKEVDEAYLAHRKADHFAVLGLKREASTDEVKKAYFELAKRFHPDRLAGHSFTDAARVSERMQVVFARISDAYKVLLDVNNREDYRQRLEAGLETAGETKGGKVRRPGEAQVQFKKALVFVQKKDWVQARRMLQMAIELDFGEPSFPAYQAWCEYLDESKPRDERELAARAQLTRLASEQPCAHASYFLGLLLKLGGDEKGAYARFKKALEQDPTHGEAAREVRLFEMRRDKARAAPTSGKPSSGLLDKLIKR
jgi:tetratricopeptide (TPR) repeat protein